MQFFKKIIVWKLTILSRLILRKYKPFIVAVTGSVGKTSTKDAIYDVLKDESGYVRKSEKSLNSEIGLPLTIIGVPNAWHDLFGWSKNIIAGMRLVLTRQEYPDCLVLEIGADHPGDIRRVTRWLKPDITVITKISQTPVHVEFFKSPEQVFEEKAALAEAVKEGGVLITYADDDKTALLGERVKSRNVRVLTYGVNNPATARGTDYAVVYEEGAPAGMSFKLDLVGETSQIALKRAIGDTYIYPLIAAAAVGKAKDMPLTKIVKALNSYEAPKGRMNLIPGLSGSTIIDDTYNSSPDAALSALGSLKGIVCSGRKIVAFGDMMELGKFSAEEHRRIGKEMSSVIGATGFLVTVGPRAKMTAEEALKSGLADRSVRAFDSADEAAAYLASIMGQGDVILVKGSQSVRMEKVSKALLCEPERAGELLVRQEAEWLAKK